MQDFNLFKQKFQVELLLIKEYNYWNLSLRPHQVTFGALIISVKGPFQTHVDLPKGAFQELGDIFCDCESVLKTNSNYSHINFLSLRMVDDFIHFHVFPRYEGVRKFDKVDFLDKGYPGMPDLSCYEDLEYEQLKKVANKLKAII